MHLQHFSGGSPGILGLFEVTRAQRMQHRSDLDHQHPPTSTNPPAPSCTLGAAVVDFLAGGSKVCGLKVGVTGSQGSANSASRFRELRRPRSLASVASALGTSAGTAGAGAVLASSASIFQAWAYGVTYLRRCSRFKIRVCHSLPPSMDI